MPRLFLLPLSVCTLLLSAVVFAADDAPKPPAYVKQATWRETVQANFEAQFAWERQQDQATLADSGVTFGPWHVLGPLAANSPDLNTLRNATSIDLGKRWPGKSGQEVGWQRRDDLKDGQLNDLSNYNGTTKDDALLLCRNVTLDRKIGRQAMAIDLSADPQGWATWLPARHGLQVITPATRGQSHQEVINEPGQYQLILCLHGGADGQRRFYFQPQPTLAKGGAGPWHVRYERRRQILARVRSEFTGPTEQAAIHREICDEIWAGRSQRNPERWLDGAVGVYLKPKYLAAIERHWGRLKADLDCASGVKAMALAGVKERLDAWMAQFHDAMRQNLAAEELRAKYYQLATIEDAVTAAGRIRSMRLAVEDQRETFGSRYPHGDAYLARIAAMEKATAMVWERVLRSVSPLPLGEGQGVRGTKSQSSTANSPHPGPLPEGEGDHVAVAALLQDLEKAESEILLSNPVLGFDKLLVVKGNSSFASNWDGPNHLGDQIVVLSPVRPDGQQTVIHKGGVASLDLHWDAKRMLISDGHALMELNADGAGLRPVSAKDPPVTHYDGCYLPGGKIVCCSNACEQAVPCTGGGNVGNLHILDADGAHERRVTYDQDHNWNPTVMNDGRVLYARWEYVELPHYFSRMLFRMNPDGTGQMEYYGSNSYWPNAMYWPRPIPGHPTQVVCVVSGHHGVSRVGELVLLDPARGRHEADGAVQRIPGYGKRVEPIIRDNLVGDSWPKFACPWPLAESETNAGAGKYFLVSVKRDEASPWDLCLVDIFDNITPILTGGYMHAVPLRPRPMPQVIPETIDPERKDAVVYLANIYQGEGLRGYPRGSIKALRVGSHQYRYAGNGDTYAASHEGGWDVKKILGTVPVNEDGSAIFRVPANTPIFVQPLDAEGKAQQIMRSWYTAMPGEQASCVGCHERQNNGPPPGFAAAAKRGPTEIAAWHGPTRGFSFDREVQPVLDHRCVGCHDGRPHSDGGKMVATPDLRAKRLRPDYQGLYSPAYVEMQKYVRRPGFESDNHMHSPAEFDADTSVLVRMLKRGHYNVQLSREEWDRLYTWIDFNVPYPVNWRESHRPPRDDQVATRAKYKKLYANIDDHDEDPLALPPIAAFEPPAAETPRPKEPMKLAGWPLVADTAAKTPIRPAAKGKAAPSWTTKELALPGGAKLKLVLVPAGRLVMGDIHGAADEYPQAAVTIDRPFYLGQYEVTNAQYAAFDPRHDSAYIEGRNKDRTTRGTPINAPEQPVVRISWNDAMAFCRWLSQETGCRATLPTEAQWEWACRAGTDTTFSFGASPPPGAPVANIADSSVAGWNYGRGESGYHDGVQFTAAVGRYAPNAWGLYDMHGNVAEWCLSKYRSYPYNAGDGRDDAQGGGLRVVRGGSWSDTWKYVTSASRWRYQAHQPVYDVGFRVLVEAETDRVAGR